MAATAAIPTALRRADIARFAHRAGQLERARPAIAYWCNYWIVDQIILKGLHQTDDESKTYTVGLMDKLEQAKADFAENDAIVDDVAGHAYVEQFAQETFQRSDNAMKASKASKQTADTFQAAATFLELCQIWGPLDQELSSKIKFAKYHALRIAKAIKAGEDPNLSNPTPEPSTRTDQPPLSPSDPDVQQLNRSIAPNMQPFVEDVHEDQDPHMHSQVSEPSPQDEGYYHNPAFADVSPLAPPDAEGLLPDAGEYFPRVSQENPELLSPSMSTAHPPAPTQLDDTLHSFPPPSLTEPHLPMEKPSTSTAFQPQPPALQDHTSKGMHDHARTIVPPATSQHLTSQPAAQSGQLRDDEVSVLAAQKHAKFAISALNFEDVQTAVKELKDALRVLGSL